jgi:hypothetical protein
LTQLPPALLQNLTLLERLSVTDNANLRTLPAGFLDSAENLLLV